MVRIGILGGQLGERVSEEPHKQWMNTISTRYYNANNKDYMFEPALAEAIKTKYKGAEAVYLKDLDEKELQKNDINFLAGLNLLYAWETSPQMYKKWKGIMKNKKNNIYPPLKEQEFLYDKGKYLMYYKQKGIPIAPTFLIDKNRKPEYILTNVKKKKWESFVIKPYHAYANVDIKRFDMDDKQLETKLQKYMKRMKKYPGFLCQEVMIGFREHYEVKSFWINGEYKYYVAVKTVDGSVFDIDELTNDDGVVRIDDTVSKKVLDQIKKMGKKIVEEFPSVPVNGVKQPPLYLRLDFGCCQGNTLDTSKYFLNEVEYAGCRIFFDAKPNAFPHWVKGYYEKAMRSFVKEKKKNSSRRRGRTRRGRRGRTRRRSRSK